MTLSFLSQSFKTYEEDKAAADCLHRDTMTVSWENIFISVPNGFASWAKPLNKESARNRKAIHYCVQLIVVCIGLVCDKWFSTVFRNVGEIDFCFQICLLCQIRGLFKFTVWFKWHKRAAYFSQYRKTNILLGPGTKLG